MCWRKVITSHTLNGRCNGFISRVSVFPLTDLSGPASPTVVEAGNLSPSKTSMSSTGVQDTIYPRQAVYCEMGQSPGPESPLVRLAVHGFAGDRDGGDREEAFVKRILEDPLSGEMSIHDLRRAFQEHMGSKHVGTKAHPGPSLEVLPHFLCPTAGLLSRYSIVTAMSCENQNKIILPRSARRESGKSTGSPCHRDWSDRRVFNFAPTHSQHLFTTIGRRQRNCY